MKKYFWIFALLLIMFSCDIIPEDELLIEVPNPPIERVVLLEDYTGQQCVNCPKAAAEIEILSEIYKENLVVVAIHAGPLSTTAMQTEAGSEYYDKFKIPYNPIGLVNRRVYNGQLTVDYQKWGEAIRDIIWKKSGISLSVISNEYNISENLLNLTVRVEKESDLDISKLSLQLWITENNILKPQAMPDGAPINMNYVHNHVLRDAPNGIWGTPLTFNGNVAEFTLSDYSLKDKGWDLTSCDLIAFVYNEENKEVLETIKTYLTPSLINK